MNIKDHLIAKIESINSVEVLLELHRVIDKLEPIINTLDRLSEYTMEGRIIQVTSEPMAGISVSLQDRRYYEAPRYDDISILDFIEGHLGEAYATEFIDETPNKSYRIMGLHGVPTAAMVAACFPVKDLYFKELEYIDPVLDEPKWFDSKIVKISSQVNNRRPKNNPIPGRKY